MKRIGSVFLLMVMLLTAIPLTVNADAPGYMEVKLTKKNVKKYIEVKKYKQLDEFGDYAGYSFRLYSKMRKKDITCIAQIILLLRSVVLKKPN